MLNARLPCLAAILLGLSSSTVAVADIRPNSLQQAAAIAIADMVSTAILPGYDAAPPTVCVAAAINIRQIDINPDGLDPDQWKTKLVALGEAGRKDLLRKINAIMGPTDLEPATWH